MFFQDASQVYHAIVIGALGYVAMILCLRVSGKRTLSQWNAFDSIVTFALGSMLATAVLAPQTSLAQAGVAFALFVALQFVITWVSVRSAWARRLIKSRPTLLVDRGVVLREVLKRERVTESEMLAAVRARGLSSVGDVHALVLETSGTFSVIKTGGHDESALADVDRATSDGRNAFAPSAS